MAQRYFGTDGIRARFGEPPLDRPTVQAIGRAIASWLASPRTVDDDAPASAAPLEIVLGGDTRESSPELARWLASGLAGGAVPVEFAYGGTLPTPALAHLVRERDADLAIALSASHNPYFDNGIKLFGPNGFKLSDAQELEVEAAIDRALAERVDGNDPPPKLDIDESLASAYADHLVETGRSLDGLKLVLDAGNGAASDFVAPVFSRLGAGTKVLSAEPDGRNINASCGSTAPESAAAAVADVGADLGVAFDGDADRVIVIDERGQVRDGDEILFLWARHLHRQDALPGAAIVATSMSNLGLERALAAVDVGVARCDVGDRAVVQMLREKGLRLGGEQSGHLVDLERHTTGDGMATAIAIAGIVAASEHPLSELIGDFRRFPQRLENVPVAAKPPFDTVPEIAEAAKRIERELEGRGRLVLRYSGTEPLARVMVEAEDQETVDRVTEELAAIVADALG